jgi:hypothetical protein
VEALAAPASLAAGLSGFFRLMSVSLIWRCFSKKWSRASALPPGTRGRRGRVSFFFGNAFVFPFAPGFAALTGIALANPFFARPFGGTGSSKKGSLMTVVLHISK